jgi:hypothetical protein
VKIGTLIDTANDGARGVWDCWTIMAGLAEATERVALRRGEDQLTPINPKLFDVPIGTALTCGSR